MKHKAIIKRSKTSAVKRSKTFVIGSIIIALWAALPAFAFQDGGRHFGALFTDAKLVLLADVISGAAMYKDKAVKVEGEISEVCQKEGCWLVMTDGERTMRVKMKGHSFAVPKDTAGKKVVVEGMVETQTISEEMARHYAEESNKKIDPSTIKGPQQVVTMIATGVRIPFE
ncbi:MAG: DUF4920 domain-containing protein [Blastocatellia bacterium]|nr:DUF4920 domain-containing protein [Blastocatellia bacterium]